jgi:hypothetical protein
MLPLTLTRDEKACYFAPLLGRLPDHLYKDYVKISDDPKRVIPMFVKSVLPMKLTLVQVTEEGGRHVLRALDWFIN